MTFNFLGNPLTLTLLVLSIAGVGYFLARRRAMARAGGDARVLHSLPNYYGMTAAMFAAVPALGVMVIWLLAQPMLIQNAVVPLLPAAATETAGTTSLVLSDVNRVAGGLTLAIEQGVLDAPAIVAAGIDPQARAETLGVAQFVALCDQCVDMHLGLSEPIRVAPGRVRVGSSCFHGVAPCPLSGAVGG